MAGIEWRSYEVGHCLHPAWSTRRGGGWKVTRFPAQAFLLRHPQRGMMLFDTGYSPHFFEATRGLPERLYRMVTPPHLGAHESLCEQLAGDGIGADDIGMIMLSHLHGDHIGGLRDFPRSALLCSREGWQDLRARGRLAALRRGLLPALLPDDFHQRAGWIEQLPQVALTGPFAPFGRAYDVWGDRSVLALALPGHAVGHYGLLFEAGDGGQVFLVADAAWSSQALRDGVPPPALVTSLLGDHRTYLDTLARLQQLRANVPQLRMIPSHCTEHGS